MSLYLITNTGTDVKIHASGGGFSRDFTAPVPARAVGVFCNNLVVDCDAELTLFGY